MATLAAFFRRMDADVVPAQDTPQRSWVEAADQYRLRPIPNEDVYFFCKKIDNSRLVRQADPRARRKCWSTIAASSLGVLALMALLLPDALGMIAGYQVHALEQQHAKLLNEKAALELQEARLLSPQRLQELAHSLQFVDPSPGQVLFLNPKADGALALNVQGK
ncbi:MAG: hypothetical protein M1541_09835 [Acidobacteria bacterium]|nr:hypothetical protein [Acidobacteriota bacterium]